MKIEIEFDNSDDLECQVAELLGHKLSRVSNDHLKTIVHNLYGMNSEKMVSAITIISFITGWDIATSKKFVTAYWWRRI